jgi:hypothetical protein
MYQALPAGILTCLEMRLTRTQEWNEVDDAAFSDSAELACRLVVRWLKRECCGVRLDHVQSLPDRYQQFSLHH